MSKNFSLSIFTESLIRTKQYTNQVRYKKSFLKAIYHLVKLDIHYQPQEKIIGLEDSKERDDRSVVTSGNIWFQVTKSHSNNLKTEFCKRCSGKHISSCSRSGYRLESDDCGALDFMRNTLPPGVRTDLSLPQSALREWVMSAGTASAKALRL